MSTQECFYFAPPGRQTGVVGLLRMMRHQTLGRSGLLPHTMSKARRGETPHKASFTPLLTTSGVRTQRCGNGQWPGWNGRLGIGWKSLIAGYPALDNLFWRTPSPPGPRTLQRTLVTFLALGCRVNANHV